MRDTPPRRAFVILTLATAIAVALPASAQEVCAEVPTLDDRCEAWVVSHDSSGGAAYGNDYLSELLVSPSGDRVYLVGGSRPSNVTVDDQLVVAFGSDGALAWEARLDGQQAGHDTARAAALSPDGSRLYVAGVTDEVVQPGGWSRADLSVSAYDTATGERLWHATYDGSDVNGPYGYNGVYDLAVSPDGERVYVTGDSLAGATRWDIPVFAFRADDGAEIWRVRLGDGEDERGRFIATDGDRVYVAGFRAVQGVAGFTMVLAAFEATDPEALGELAWRVDVTDAGSESPLAMALSGGRLFVGTSRNRVLSFETATGDRPWAAPLQHSVADLTLDPAGERVVVTGTRSKPPQAFGLVARDLDFGTTVLDAGAGSLGWFTTYELPGRTEEEARAVAVSPGGDEIYVTGYSSDAYYTYVPGFATVAYDAASGDQLWQARYRETPAVIDADTASEIAVAPGGDRLYVGGMFNPRPDLDTMQVGTSDLALAAYDLQEG